MKGLVFVWLLSHWLLAGSLHAQTGSWIPAGANLTYPRTLITANELERVRENLGTTTNQALYAGLYAEVLRPVPGDNTSSAGRRTRATFAKNAAFAVLLGRQPAGAGLAPLPAAERAALVDASRTLLESLNPNVEVFIDIWKGTTPYTEWQWRSKELIDYLIAYDLLRGAGETPADLAASQARLQEFAGNLYQQATTPVLNFSFYSSIKNNHALMTAAALGMAAVVLNEATSTDRTRQPAAWAGAGLYQIDNVLWRDAQRQSDSTQVAGYAEGPYYCKYALLNCLPFFRALGNFLPDARQAYTFGASTRSIHNPYYDPKYTRLYEWLTAIMLPDGRLPALADSYVDMAMPELALTGQPQFVRPLALSGLTGTNMNSLTAQLRDATVDMRAAYLAAALDPSPAAAAMPTLTALPASGNLIFRSGADSLASYLHLVGRSGPAQASGGGHSQGDAGSFLLYAHGQLLALDPGYLSYSRRDEVNKATSHNLVLVDGAGPESGTAGVANPVGGTVQHTLHTPQLSYGEVQTAYQGASLVRKALFVRHAYYLLADDARAAAPRTYTWQLHGAGLAGGAGSTGTFADSLARHEGTWQKSGASLLAHVTATGGATAYTTATKTHETTYNTAEKHTTLLVQKSGLAQAQFLAALYPHTGRAPRFRTTSGAGTAALAGAGAYFDVAFAQADTLLQADASGLLPQVVRADGQLNFYSADSTGAFTQLFLEQGTVLYADTLPLVRSARRATVSWQKASATHYDGSVSRATTLTLALGAAPREVSGAGVASYAYNAERRQLAVVLNQPTAFAVELAAAQSAQPTPLPVVLTAFTARRTGASRVALAWQTASEINSQGFEVQRSTQPAAGFETLGFVPSQRATQQAAAYAFEDGTPPNTLTYYRLRQLDVDGTATYSPVATVAGGPAAASLLTWPQPARHTLWVQFADPQAEVQLRLLDATGRAVRQLSFRQQTQLEVGTLAPGLYFLQALGAQGQPLAPNQKVLLAP